MANTTRRMDAALAIALMVTLASASRLSAHPDDPKLLDHMPPYHGPGYRADDDSSAAPRGVPEEFDASGVILKSWISLDDFQAYSGLIMDNANSGWGYTSPSGREYAIIGLNRGTAFVEVTNPGNAQIVGFIQGPTSLWRDVRIYKNYAYTASEGGGGIQIINLANIDGATNRVTLVGTVTQDGTIPTTATHTLIINEESGYLYRCGGSSNGLRIYSLANPATPVLVGQWSNRYVHECQVVTYHSGPYAGHEIAFCCSGSNYGYDQTGLDILDVTNKSNIVNLYPPRVFWSDAGYSHQICLSWDRRYAYLDDELDEQHIGGNTRTIIIDVSFLIDSQVSAPFVAGAFFGSTTAIGHNLYTKGNLIFEANYRHGLQIYCAGDPFNVTEIGFFDTFPGSDSANFNGAWNTFPYFPSGTVTISDIERGLFVLDVSGAVAAANCCGPADGDLTGEGVANGRDVTLFVNALMGTPSQANICHGDFDADTQLGTGDIPGFVAALLGP